MQDSLFGSLSRSADPKVTADWRDANRRYRNFKIVEKSMSGGGVETAEGQITGTATKDGG